MVNYLVFGKGGAFGLRSFWTLPKVSVSLACPAAYPRLSSKSSDDLLRCAKCQAEALLHPLKGGSMEAFERKIVPPPDRPKRSEGKNNAIVQYRCSGAEGRGVGLSRQPAGVTTKKKKGGADFWGKSGVREKRGSSEAVARPFEGSRMGYGTEFCKKTRGR